MKTWMLEVTRQLSESLAKIKELAVAPYAGLVNCEWHIPQNKGGRIILEYLVVEGAHVGYVECVGEWTADKGYRYETRWVSNSGGPNQTPTCCSHQTQRDRD